MKIRMQIWLLLLPAFILSGCATGPKLTQSDILGQYERIAELDKGLKDAAAQDLGNLAPDGYSAARAQFEEAVAEVQAGRADTANVAAGDGLLVLEKANESAGVSRDLLREVLEARSRADKAGAAAIFPDKTADLEEDLRKVTSLIERGKLEDAKKRRQKLFAGYEQLELAALQEGTVQAAQAAIASAKKNDAPRYAPKTFKLAEEEMKLAQTVLAADRSQTDKANTHAKRAKWTAERSAAITELIKDFDRRDFSSEDAVLWYQQQLSEINSPLNKEVPFNEPNRNVVLGMQQMIADLLQQRDDTDAQRSRYEQELSLTEEQRAAIDKVQALFTPAEATVYQQRRNVLISAHGFLFPSGGSEIGTENFVLMNKIIQAVNTFPESNIEISGHTDSTGGAAVNKKLSKDRAASVAKFLVDVGNIKPSRITVTGYGPEKPVASNATNEGRAANRRVEILIDNR